MELNEFSEQELYRSITAVVCSSLDLEVVLNRLARLVSKYMPLSGIVIFTYDRQTNTLSPLAEALYGHVKRTPSRISLPKDLVDNLHRDSFVQQISNSTEPIALASIANNANLHRIQGLVRPDVVSSIRINLISDDQYAIIANIYAFGKQKYTDKHLRIAKLFQEPLSVAVSNIVQYETLAQEKDALQEENSSLKNERQLFTEEFIACKSGGMEEVMTMVHHVARTEAPVLIHGETGVGKELVANAIHYLSSRSGQPLIKVNCGAIPDTLIDSELFGHEKGAFTGAVSTSRGKFERADNGVIFLDEIGELPLQAQARLLRVLQFREVERVGGTRPIKLDIRIMAATHRDLKEMVRQGKFREDLWFRLNVFPIDIPPLRERKQDIPYLANLFISRKCREMNIRPQPRICARSMARMTAYDWPGNVRELENLIERSLIINRGKDVLECVSFDADNPIRDRNESTDEPFMTLNEMNARYIAKVLKHTKGKIHGKGGAAEILGINSSTLRSRMEKLGIPHLV